MAEQGHRVMIESRNSLEIKGGVEHVHSFDSNRIILDTAYGFMDILGEDLHIEELNLEGGNLAVAGNITGVKYSQGKGLKGKSKNVLSRILK